MITTLMRKWIDIFNDVDSDSQDDGLSLGNSIYVLLALLSGSR